MRKIETTVYTFDELSEKAQAKAIEKEMESLRESDFIMDGFKEYCEDKAKKLGFNQIQLQYSLSYSQGDGLSFSCKDFDLDAFLSKNLNRPLFEKILSQYLTYVLKGNDGRYCFASRGDVDLYLDSNTNHRPLPNIQTVVEKLLNTLENEYLTLCKDLEKQGYAWYEGGTNEEAAKENILSNDFEFTEEGDMI